MHTNLTLTTVRVRRARTQTLQQHNLQAKTAGNPLVEMLVHGAVRAVAELDPNGPIPTLEVLWAEKPWDEDLDAVKGCVAGALGVMKPAHPKGPAGGPTTC